MERREFLKKSGRGVLAASLLGRASSTWAAPVAEPPGAGASLFEALDLSLPALAWVKAAVERGDSAGAKAALAKYLRERTGVPWKISPRVADRKSIKWSPAEAEDAANANLYGGLVKVKHQFPNGDIDWRYNATEHTPGEAPNNEWTWQLNRMSWWSTLGDAYAATGDEKYARAWVKQLRSWVAQNPMPAKSERNAGSTWRGIEAGLRMGWTWPGAFYRFLLSPSFTDDDVALFVQAVLDHGRYLHKFPSSGNHLTMEMSGLYTAGALFPELKESADWRRTAVATMQREMGAQFLPDGAQYELATGYHGVALDNILAVYNVAKIVGRQDELPRDYTAGAEKAYEYPLYLMTPDRMLPKFNDSWPSGVPSAMKKAFELFPARRDFEWAATDGKSGTPPRETSHAFGWAGYFIMRSGWGRDANYLAFDAGPLGYSHVHQDKLNLIVHVFGRELLFDGGGGSYEKSKWRSYATDTFAHNTVLVDGKPQRRRVNTGAGHEHDPNMVSQKAIDARWKSTPEYDFAAGTYSDGYGKEDARIATHTRRVLFVKPDLFIVADTLAPSDTTVHIYQARWHLLPTQTSLDASTWSVSTTDEGQPNLAIAPLVRGGLEVNKASAQETPELLGWNIRKDMSPQYVPATTVTHARRGVGVQHFLTLLLPLKANEKDPVQSVQATGATSADVVLADGRLLQIAADPDPARGITVREALPGGKAGRSVTAGF